MSNRSTHFQEDGERWCLPDVKSGLTLDSGEYEEGPQVLIRNHISPQVLASAEEKAYQNGFEKGVQAGREMMEAEFAGARELLQKLSSALVIPVEALDDRITEHLVALGLAVATRLVGHELETAPSWLMDVVSEALREIAGTGSGVSIRLHSQDARLMRELQWPDESAGRVKILEDDGLTRGGFQLLSDDSTLDATVEAQILRITARASSEDIADLQVAGESGA